jgi:hypothetical protein
MDQRAFFAPLPISPGSLCPKSPYRPARSRFYHGFGGGIYDTLDMILYKSSSNDNV